MKVFVYGTLKKGGHGNIACDMQTMICEPVGRQLDLIMVAGLTFNFPAATPGNGSVAGELWEVDDQTFQRMTRFEGGLYRQETIETDHGPAETFLWNDRLYSTNDLQPISGSPAAFSIA